jgi:hypothetical protein
MVGGAGPRASGRRPHREKDASRRETIITPRRETRDRYEFYKENRELLRGEAVKAEIRFDLKVVPVTSIAEQWYCEKAVDLHYRHPTILFSTPALAAGTIEHDYFTSGAELLTEQEIKERIKSGKSLTLREVPFKGPYRGIMIKGIPDYVSIKDGKALFLLDYKFSSYRRVFPSHRIQVDTYGYLLHRNRLSTDDLICAIAVLSPRLSREILSPEEITALISKRQAEIRRRKLERLFLNAPGLYGELYTFSLAKAKENLSWAVDYWAKKRKPIPTTKPKKCGACSFNASGLCKSALIPAG